MQSVEKTFQLTRSDRELLVKPEYDMQAWCILLNDKVSFRMQWPQYAELQINVFVNESGAVHLASISTYTTFVLQIVARMLKDLSLLLRENLVENLLRDFEFELQVPYLLYQNPVQEVNGIWFYNARECEDVSNLFISEFEALEVVPTSVVAERPLELPFTTSSSTYV